jgi:hypothetical protein
MSLLPPKRMSTSSRFDKKCKRDEPRTPTPKGRNPQIAKVKAAKANTQAVAKFNPGPLPEESSLFKGNQEVGRAIAGKPATVHTWDAEIAVLQKDIEVAKLRKRVEELETKVAQAE